MGQGSRVKFTKAVATGNDFVVIDNRSSVLGRNLPGIARDICDRKFGVGADGLLLVERSKKADLKMRIFNSDGSEAQMCGNGSRCVALFAKVNRIAKGEMTIDTLAGILNASVKGDEVKVRLTDPKDLRMKLICNVNDCDLILNFVNTGVPHTVYFVDDIGSIDVKGLGREVRYHPDFAPAGTNVNFVTPSGKNAIKIRTYERGVEDETLACGTGSTAGAIISAVAYDMSSPVTVLTKSGEKLKVHFKKAGAGFKDVYLEGKARLVFDGMLLV